MARPRTRRGPRGKVADLLRATRARLGLTQAEAAAALGVALTTVGRWEAGHVRPVGLVRRYVVEWCERALGKGGKHGA